MSLRLFLRGCAIRFFIIATCITLALAIFGSAIQPNTTFGFGAFYSPLIGAALGTLPSIILYSRRELNLRQTIIRKILRLLFLEILIIGFSMLTEKIFSLFQIILVGFIVIVVSVAVNIIEWSLQMKDAGEINAGLRTLQNRK